MKNFKKVLLQSKKEIDKEIKTFFDEKTKDESLSPEMVENIKRLEKFVLNGGKRFRPVTLLLAYKGCYGTKNILREAISVELFHNATLVEDDFMDEDENRRGKPTIYKILKDEFLDKFGEKKYNGSLYNRESSRFAVSNSILLGNVLYALGAECLSTSKLDHYKIREALSIYNDAFIKVNDGQLLDVELEKIRANEQDYIEMAEKKTACLVAAAFDIGAVLAGADRKQRNMLHKFAMLTTVAFQIQDDLLDINPDANKGHELGSDIKTGKNTLLTIKTLELGTKKEKRALEKAYGKARISDDKLNKAIQAMHTSGAVDYCKNLAKKKVKLGKQWLTKAHIDKQSEGFFQALAEYLINRDI